jgi:hypothetical protein
MDLIFKILMGVWLVTLVFFIWVCWEGVRDFIKGVIKR